MSGHSKWSSIKHQKGAADAKRGKVFTKLGHAVTVAARQGGGDASANPRLALAIELAKKQNLPKENIERAISRGTGGLGGPLAEELSYESYGPGGSAIYIEALTDNRNRTVNEIRALLNKYGGRLGETGSVSYLFKQFGLITLAPAKLADEALELILIEAGADDYQPNEEGWLVATQPRDLMVVKDKLEAIGLVVVNAELRYEPIQTLNLADPKLAEQLARLTEALEELDDVTRVVTNALPLSV